MVRVAMEAARAARAAKDVGVAMALAAISVGWAAEEETPDEEVG